MPTSPSLPALCAFTQYPNVDGARDNRRAASGNDSLSSVTNCFLAEFPRVSSLRDTFHTDTSVALSYPTLVSVFPILSQLAGGHLYFKRVPRDENALIAIFFELVGRGDLAGYHFYSLSQSARYDGRASMKLSYQTDVPMPDVDSDLRNVEFKLDVNDLVDDFAKEIKIPAEIQLVIVWDDTLKSSITDFQVLDIEYTDDGDRAISGVEKVLHCKLQNRMIQMLVMKDFVNQLDFGKDSE